MRETLAEPGKTAHILTRAYSGRHMGESTQSLRSTLTTPSSFTGAGEGVLGRGSTPYNPSPLCNFPVS